MPLSAPFLAGKGRSLKASPKRRIAFGLQRRRMGLKSNPAAWPHVGKARLVGREHLRLVSGGPFQQRINPLSSYSWSRLLIPLNQLRTPREGPPPNLYPEPGSPGKEPGRNWTLKENHSREGVVIADGYLGLGGAQFCRVNLPVGFTFRYSPRTAHISLLLAVFFFSSNCY